MAIAAGVVGSRVTVMVVVLPGALRGSRAPITSHEWSGGRSVG
jgi:hypothetical protein